LNNTVRRNQFPGAGFSEGFAERKML